MSICNSTGIIIIMICRFIQPNANMFNIPNDRLNLLQIHSVIFSCHINNRIIKLCLQYKVCEIVNRIKVR